MWDWISLERVFLPALDVATGFEKSSFHMGGSEPSVYVGVI